MIFSHQFPLNIKPWLGNFHIMIVYISLKYYNDSIYDQENKLPVKYGGFIQICYSEEVFRCDLTWKICRISWNPVNLSPSWFSRVPLTHVPRPTRTRYQLSRATVNHYQRARKLELRLPNSSLDRLRSVNLASTSSLTYSLTWSTRPSLLPCLRYYKLLTSLPTPGNTTISGSVTC